MEDLEDEVKQQARRNEEKTEEKFARMDENHRANMERRENELRETQDRYIKHHSEVVAKEREMTKADMERVRKQTYDRWGRNSPGVDADVLKAQLIQERSRNEALEAQSAKSNARLEDELRSRVSQLNEDHADRLAKTAEIARDSAQATYHEVFERQRESYEGERDQLRKQLGELAGRLVDETEGNRRETLRMIEETQRDSNHQVSKMREAQEKLHLKHAEESIVRAEKQSNVERLGREQENRHLRNQVKDLLAHERDVRKDVAQAQHDVVKEFEDQWRGRERSIIEGFENSLAKEKAQNERQQVFLAAQNHENMIEKDRNFAQVVSRYLDDNYAWTRQTQDTFQKEREALETRLSQERENHRGALETFAQDAGVEREKALINQARAYQDTITRTRAQMTDREKSLEQALLAKNSAKETNEIPIAAENAVKRPVIEHYHKLLEAEQARNKAATDSIKTEYTQRIEDLLNDRSDRSRETLTQTTRELHEQRKLTQDTLQEALQDRDFILRTQNQDHLQQVQTMQRGSARSLEEQRRNILQAAEAQIDELQQRLKAQKSDSEFQLKQTSRTFAQNQSALIRDYEKRLAEMKQEADARISEVRSESNRELREAERKAKHAGEQMIQTYEQRIKTMETQFQERERVLAQNHEETLDRMRRSHAELVKKKS
jgi:hypothetical protein